MNRAAVLSISVLLFCCLIVFPFDAFSQTPYLREGIEQYKQENYEEAAELLIKERKQNPRSSVAAFFLGLTYKQMEDYQKALEHLRDAVALTPRIMQALVELVDVALQLGKLEEAKKWLAVAEEAEIIPAKIAFLKGQALMKEGKNLEAVKLFEKARSLDKSFSQSAEVQIAICYMKERDLKKARERLRAALLYDPESDQASFARNYLDVVEKRIELERPFRLTLGISEQYNTNLLLNPNDPEFTDTDDVKSYSTVPSIRLNYVPVLKGPWLFNAQYAISANFHEKYRTTRDTISNSIGLVPGYNFGRSALNLAVSYNHVMLRGPNWERYQESLSLGPLFRMLFAQNHVLELSGGYKLQEVSPQTPVAQEEDRDSETLSTYISWIWIFQRDAFFNLRYEYTDEDTDGVWWDNEGHKFSANLVIPLIDKLKLQLSGQAFLQDYKNNHLLLSNIDKRDDETYITSLGFTWEFFKNTSFLAQWTGTIVNSNIGYYKYEQDLYSVSIEYRY